jgi:hypothetical protein
MNSLQQHYVEDNKNQPFPTLEITQNKIYTYHKFTKKKHAFGSAINKKIMAILFHFPKNTTLHILTLSESSYNLSFMVRTSVLS